MFRLNSSYLKNRRMEVDSILPVFLTKHRAVRNAGDSGFKKTINVQCSMLIVVTSLCYNVGPYLPLYMEYMA